MKTTVAPFDTLAICLRIVCTNGTTIRVTRYPRDLVMSNGQVYLTGSGFDFTGYEATNGFSEDCNFIWAWLPASNRRGRCV